MARVLNGKQDMDMDGDPVRSRARENQGEPLGNHEKSKYLAIFSSLWSKIVMCQKLLSFGILQLFASNFGCDPIAKAQKDWHVAPRFASFWLLPQRCSCCRLWT